MITALAIKIAMVSQIHFKKKIFNSSRTHLHGDSMTIPTANEEKLVNTNQFKILDFL